MTERQNGGSGVFRPLLVGILGVVVTLVIIGRHRFEQEIKGHVDDLLTDVDGYSDRGVSKDDIEGLPAPVERYFEHVLDEGHAYVRAVRLRQRGEFRLGSANGSWRPLVATQYFSMCPPAFVWDARIDVVPLIPARVLDLYERGEGLLRANLFSAFPVASAGPSPEMNSGELVRYLAEAVWFPTALLPTQGVEWEAIDDRSARATLEDRGVTASLVFHFDDRDEVARVTTERYRQEDDSYAPWTGHFRDYEVRNGLRIPTAAEVEWNLPDGDLRYWRARIEAIDYCAAGSRSAR